MNRQQRRAQAKMKQKNNSINLSIRNTKSPIGKNRLTERSQNRSIINFGAFYRGETDHGMGVTLYKHSGIPQDLLNQTYDNVIEFGNQILESFDHNVNLAGCDRNEQITQIVSVMEAATANFNNYAYKREDGQQPAGGGMAEHAVDFEWIQKFTVCAAYSGALVCLGVIADDNQNGLSTMQAANDIAKEFA